MQKLFSLGICAFATVMLGSVAQAADLPVKAPAPPAPVYSWTGCYIGAGGGYGMWNQDVVALDTITGPFSARQTGGGRGWFGTAQVGCDYQLSSNWVRSAAFSSAIRPTRTCGSATTASSSCR